MNNLVSFNDFVKIFESIAEVGDSDTELFIAASNASEKEAQNRFIVEASMMDPKRLEANLKGAMSFGDDLVSELVANMQERVRSGVDKGPLTRKGDWYVGEGAWRINSAKANKMGMTPAYLTWDDPMQDELIREFFPEEFGLSKSSISPKGELQLSDVPAEEELVPNESFKYIRVMEDGSEFTLGPTGQAGNAVVVDQKTLVKDLVRNFFLAKRKNVMIWGAPGIGKTQIVEEAARQCAAKLGEKVPVCVVTLATKAAYDLSGIPFLFGSKESQATIQSGENRGNIGMDFAYPGWLPPSDSKEQGILFFDEINRAEPTVLGAALTLLLDRKTGQYVMPDGYRVWAAGNRDVDGPVFPFEGAVASRFLGGHFHLVPTIDDWVKWARSENAYFKGTGKGTETNEWFVPDEFLSFLQFAENRQADSTSGTITSLGKTYRIKFNHFYNWDKASSEESGGGQMTGFPTPRTWAESFATIFEYLRDSEFINEVSPTVDPRMKTISVLGIASLDGEFYDDMYRALASTVGVDSATMFMQYLKTLSKYNDAEGTLTEKIENIFTNPKGARLLVNIPKVGADEQWSLLQAVGNKFDSLINDGKLKIAEVSNWMKWVLEISTKGKVSADELNGHISNQFNKHALELKPLIAKSNPELTPDMATVIQEFVNTFREVMAKYNTL